MAITFLSEITFAWFAPCHKCFDCIFVIMFLKFKWNIEREKKHHEPNSVLNTSSSYGIRFRTKKSIVSSNDFNPSARVKQTRIQFSVFTFRVWIWCWQQFQFVSIVCLTLFIRNVFATHRGYWDLGHTHTYKKCAGSFWILFFEQYIALQHCSDFTRNCQHQIRIWKYIRIWIEYV